MKNILVIHHSADFDGLFSREVARHEFGDSADYIGWDYGDPIPVVPSEVGQLYMIDISVDGLMDDPRLIWIDHHKSAMDKFSPAIKGYRIDGVAACRLACQWFLHRFGSGNAGGAAEFVKFPEKVNYVDRTVFEPYALRLAGEYDIWDRRDPDAELFQHGLRSRDLTQEVWDTLLWSSCGYGLAKELLGDGRAVQYAKTKENESIAKHFAFTIEFEGMKFCAINAARYNSHLFTAGLKPEHDGCFGFNFDGKQWRVSLYHAPGKEHHDLSKIAVKYGGGGHRGACGFKVPALSFLR